MFKKLIRIASGVFASLLMLAGILWFVGGYTYVTTAEVKIAAPPQEVFAYLSEPDKIMQWLEGVTKIEPLTESGHRVGARSKVTVHEGNETIEMQEEVIRVEPDKLTELRLTCPMFDATSLYELTDDQGQTLVKQTLRADYQGIVRIVAPLMSGAVQQKMDADFQRLKQLVEKKTSGSEE
jgi:uncharacterized protein YndB with AHSA1/START domain